MNDVNGLAVPIAPSPTAENQKVRPRRRRNADVRPREYLTPTEVHQLECAAGRSGRYGQRDRTLILIMYRHGLRVTEAVTLRWDQIDLTAGLMTVARIKRGNPSTHPLRGPELRALRELRREWPDSPYVFVTERGGPMGTGNVRKMIERAGKAAKIPFPVHPHMLRHSTGHKLVMDGQDTRSIQHYLGHRNIMHTVRYTEMSPDRFKGFFRD